MSSTNSNPIEEKPSESSDVFDESSTTLPPLRSITSNLGGGGSPSTRRASTSTTRRQSEPSRRLSDVFKVPPGTQLEHLNPGTTPDVKRDAERATPTDSTKERKRDWSGWLSQSLATETMVPALVLQAFSTGILDATTYADFRTFASNQTGNTILLTVFILDIARELLLLTGVSLASFLGAAFFFGRLGHAFGLRRRAWLLLTTFIQFILLLISAFLVSPIGPPSTQVGGDNAWAVIMLFASMSGGQVAMARQSGSQELPTAPMTSSYVDLMADKYLFVRFTHPKAGPRNRRLAYILAMIIGGLIGALAHKFAGSWVVVVMTMALKLGVISMFCYSKGQ